MADGSVLRTAEGTNTEAFEPRDWGAFLSLTVIWGSSFLWIAIAVESIAPSTVALFRLLLGAGALALYPPARQPIARRHFPAVALVGLAGNAAPALLFSLALQRVESSVAGMINASVPLAAMLIGIAMTRRLPQRAQVGGMVVGFAGVAAMTAPNLSGGEAQPLGVGLLLLAVVGYGLTNNIIVPLQQAYGGPAVIMRAQVFGALLLAPWGIYGMGESDPTAGAIAAMLVLGIVGTGLARALNANFTGRNGVNRTTMVAYTIPVTAIFLGVVFRDESIESLEIVGTVLVLAGAFLSSRKLRS